VSGLSCSLFPSFCLLSLITTELADRVASSMSHWKEIVGKFDRIVVRGDPEGHQEILPAGHAEAWEVRFSLWLWLWLFGWLVGWVVFSSVVAHTCT